MFALTIFAIATLFFFLRSKFGNENEEILTMTTYIIGVGTAIVFLLLFFGKEEPTIDLMYLGFIPFFLFGIHYIKKKTKATDISVITNQQRYFNEVRGTDIYDFYKTRKSVKKKNRVETLVNKHSKKLIKDDAIVPSFFLDFKDFTPTKVESMIIEHKEKGSGFFYKVFPNETEKEILKNVIAYRDLLKEHINNEKIFDDDKESNAILEREKAQLRDI